MNNPLKYTDPNGEFIFSYAFNFFKGFFKGKNPFKTGWKGIKNEVKLYGGLFHTDSNKSFLGRYWEFWSRITWQLPQTVLGFSVNYHFNNFGLVENVTHEYGVTAVDAGIKGAITIGNYTTGPRGYKADWKDHLFVHEYGHYIQSQQFLRNERCDHIRPLYTRE